MAPIATRLLPWIKRIDLCAPNNSQNTLKNICKLFSTCQYKPQLSLVKEIAKNGTIKCNSSVTPLYKSFLLNVRPINLPPSFGIPRQLVTNTSRINCIRSYHGYSKLLSRCFKPLEGQKLKGYTVKRYSKDCPKKPKKVKSKKRLKCKKSKPKKKKDDGFKCKPEKKKKKCEPVPCIKQKVKKKKKKSKKDKCKKPKKPKKVCKKKSPVKGKKGGKGSGKKGGKGNKTCKPKPKKSKCKDASKNKKGKKCDSSNKPPVKVNSKSHPPSRECGIGQINIPPDATCKRANSGKKASSNPGPPPQKKKFWQFWLMNAFQ